MSDVRVMQANSGEDENTLKMIGITEAEAKEASSMIEKFVRDYSKKDVEVDDRVWLEKELKTELPEKSDEEIHKISDDIYDSVQEYDSNYEDICKAAKKGIESNKWLANKVSEVSTGVSIIEYGNYLNAIDNSISNANAQMMRTVTTNAGEISQCMNLDGFIA